MPEVREPSGPSLTRRLPLNEREEEAARLRWKYLDSSVVGGAAAKEPPGQRERKAQTRVPVGPLQLVPVGLLQLVPVGLLQLVPVGPLKLVPVGPLKLVPVGPLKLVPVGPLQLVPVGPLKLVPVGPLKLVPVGPLQLAPVGPLQLAPVGPLQLAPVGPLQLAPVEAARPPLPKSNPMSRKATPRAQRQVERFPDGRTQPLEVHREPPGQP